MTKVGAGKIIYDLRKKIQEITHDLNQLGELPSDIPEMIVSANLLRSNEFLSKVNDKKTELVSAYAEYSEALEEMLSSVFEIQKDLKEILKIQSSMLESKKKKPSVIKPKKRKTAKSKSTKK